MTLWLTLWDLLGSDFRRLEAMRRSEAWVTRTQHPFRSEAKSLQRLQVWVSCESSESFQMSPFQFSESHSFPLNALPFTKGTEQVCEFILCCNSTAHRVRTYVWRSVSSTLWLQEMDSCRPVIEIPLFSERALRQEWKTLSLFSFLLNSLAQLHIASATTFKNKYYMAAVIWAYQSLPSITILQLTPINHSQCLRRRFTSHVFKPNEIK